MVYDLALGLVGLQLDSDYNRRLSLLPLSGQWQLNVGWHYHWSLITVKPGIGCSFTGYFYWPFPVCCNLQELSPHNASCLATKSHIALGAFSSRCSFHQRSLIIYNYFSGFSDFSDRPTKSTNWFPGHFFAASLPLDNYFSSFSGSGYTDKLLVRSP